MLVANDQSTEKAISRGDAEVAEKIKTKLEKNKSLIGICCFGCWPLFWFLIRFPPRSPRLRVSMVLNFSLTEFIQLMLHSLIF
jgi:hypothetical protein